MTPLVPCLAPDGSGWSMLQRTSAAEEGAMSGGRKVFAVVFALLITAVGCSGSGTKNAAGTVVVMLPSDNPGDIQLRRTQAEAFMKSHPGIKVQVQVIPSEGYNERVFTSIAGGNAPDIFNSGDVVIPSIVSRHVALDLSQFVDKENYDLGAFYPEVINGLTFENQLVGLTDNWDTQVMYYNRDLFQKAGVPEPTDDWTWDDVVSAAQKITSGSGASKTWGLLYETWFAPLDDQIYSFGGQVFSEDGTQCLLDEPQSVAALQSIVDVMKAGYAPEPSVFEQEGQDPFSIFAAGHAGMWIGSGRWSAFDLQSAKGLNWAIAPRPNGPDHPRSNFFHLAMYAITSASNDKANAWEFLKYMVSPEGITQAFENMQGIPSRPDLADDPKITNSEIVQEHDAFQPFIDSLPTVRPAPFLSNFFEVDDAIGNGLDPIWRGEADVQSTATQVCQRVDQLLQEQS
jgi:multiple sugar transport system substrate-binding protein